MAVAPLGSGAANDQQMAEPRQRCDEIVGKTIDETVLLGVRRKIGKRENQDGRLVGRWPGSAPWRRSRFVMAFNAGPHRLVESFVRLSNGGNETVSLARQSANKALPLAVVPDRMTGGEDP